MGKRGIEEDKHLHTAIFTMVIALLMLCFQRAVVVVSLVDRWRARIFLLLNLVLLAVLFTSFHFSTRSGNNEHQGYNNDKEEEKTGEKIATKRIHLEVVTNTSSTSSTSSGSSSTCSGEKSESARKKTSTSNDVVINRKAEEDVELSEEELNRRVEAFIIMFRQQLVSDASKTRRESAKQRTV